MICILVVQIIYLGVISSKLPYTYPYGNFFMVLSEFLLTVFLLFVSAWVIFDYLGEDFIYFSNRTNLSWAMQFIMLMSVFTRIIGFIFEAKYIYDREQSIKK